MTPLPAFSEQVVERRDLPEYEIEGRCANPRCPNRADDPHEIRPRSQTAGVVWWVELPGRFLIGNRAGLCRGCHERTDAHTAAIIWDDQETELAWADLDGNWAEALDPMPPIHRMTEMLPEPIPVGNPPTELLTYTGPSDQPVELEQVEGYPPAADEMVTLGNAMQNMDRFLENMDAPIEPAMGEPIRQTSPGFAEVPVVVDERVPENTAALVGPEGVEGVITGIEPNVLEPEPEPEPPAGDDEATVMRARQAAEEAQQHAVDVTALGEFVPGANVEPWRADVVIFPEEQRVEVLHGDMRVGSFVEEQIAKAKRAPKKREPKPAEDPDREKEPAKARRTYSISVPADERDGEKVAAGEDGYQLIEEALDNLRQRFGRDDHPGWRYFVLLECLQWMLLNYTDEGEDG